MTVRENPSGRLPPARGESGRFQFGMRGLMATIILLCIPFAIWGGLLRAGGEGDGESRLVLFVLLSVAAPMGMMLVVAALPAAIRLYRRLRPHNDAVETDDSDDFVSGR